jgi:hypothetical protein
MLRLEFSFLTVQVRELGLQNNITESKAREFSWASEIGEGYPRGIRKILVAMKPAGGNNVTHVHQASIRRTNIYRYEKWLQKHGKKEGISRLRDSIRLSFQ